MKDEIINRVANSKLVTLDLEDYYPKGARVSFDISPWLLEGIVLKESDFREKAKTYDWSKHQDQYVALYCSTDAIIPGWAYMFLSLQLAPYSKKVVVGDLEELEKVLFTELLVQFDVSTFIGQPVIIKGCTKLPIPDNAFVLLAQRLQEVAKSIMYGEACSSVPLYKNRGVSSMK